MKRVVVYLLFVCLSVFILFHTASSREIDGKGLRVMRGLQENGNPLDIDGGARGLVTAAAVDTYCVVWYDFEVIDWQGWTRVDNTEQVDTFFHVDDFTGLGGGDYGGLTALEGLKSMWCGTRPAGDPLAGAPFEYLCSWLNAPGYGNDWDQILETDFFGFTGLITFSYRLRSDCEPDYDLIEVQYDSHHEDWVTLAEYDGSLDTFTVHELALPKIATKIRFRFTSDGAWSDQDGLWNTDGALIVDELTIADDLGTINYEDFEASSNGDKSAGIWRAKTQDPFGTYSGLAANLVTNDPCNVNHATQVAFFFGSVIPAPGYPWPGYYSTPFCTGPGGVEAPCQDEMIVSPVIDLDYYSSSCDDVQDTPIDPGALPDLGGLILRYTIYRDLPLQNLVFDIWEVRSVAPDGCPGAWVTRNIVYYYKEQGYVFETYDISDLIMEDRMQVALGVVDMCDDWFDSYGDCAEHTPAPWYDNVRLYRYSSVGPRWSYRGLDLFQDNFPEQEFDLNSWVRADAANDLRPNDDPVIDPGDSAVVTCSADHIGGLQLDGYGNPMVYCHVKASYVGDPSTPKPDLAGPAIAGNYGNYASDDGTWTILQMAPARYSGGMIAENKFMVDFDDSLFTYGYMVEYYFRAYGADASVSCLPENAESGSVELFEFTCLPTTATNVLYVDDFDGRGTFEGTVQTYLDATCWVWPNADRYDVKSPSSLVSNGPGSRAKNYHMTMHYDVIYWDSGNLNYGTISEGTVYSDKSGDCQMLIDWMDFSEHDVGLLVMGDDIAEDLWGAPSPSALALIATYCGVSLVDGSYYEMTGGYNAGGVVNPLVTGVTGGIYDGLQYYVFGGCPVINSFDVLDIIAAGMYSLQLPDYDGNPYYIGIASYQLNALGFTMKTSWIGHSLMYMRDIPPGSVEVREALLGLTNDFFEEPYIWCGDEETPKVFSLGQNYPNPFNPVTRIEFGLPFRSHVRLKVYNVAGQLVKTLTDEVWEAGRHNIDWDGTNNRGAGIASGVYFYRIEAGEFVGERKMVLLR